jgi:transcriptional regulator with XRE-family HTH domain
MRKPKSETPLRQVRLASGLSQKEFAAYLGLGVDLYHSLELGRVTLTKQKAQSIALKTGADPQSLDPKASKLAIGDDNEPYTARTWKALQRGKSLWPWAKVEAVIQWMEFLCRIAEREHKLTELCFELSDCLTKARDNVGLRSVVMCELGRTNATMGVASDYGYLRANKMFAKKVGFTDANNLVPDNAVWSGQFSYTPSWSPCSMLPPELAEKFGINRSSKSKQHSRRTAA